MQAISFKKVNFSYQGTDEQSDSDVFSLSDTFALKNVDFSVQEGEFVAILGHNGSGKSTLARLTNGLLSPDAGEISVLGLDACNEKNLFEIRKQVGIVFQNPDNQTVASIVEDDVAFGPENIGVPREEIGQRIDFALNAVGMEKYRHSTTSRLSGGQKQRIAIAGVLALKPKIIILDESTAMLDPRGRKEVMDVVVELNKQEKMTVVLITHFPEEALLADRAIVMHRGQIVMEGTPKQVLSNEAELKKYALTLPKSLQICHGLRQGGLAVDDAHTDDELAEEIVYAIAKTPVTLPEFHEERVEETTAQEKMFIPSVVCENLSYTYNDGSPFASHALNGVDLTVNEGDFFGIIGHTGSGKSTFVQHLNALIKLPTAEKKYKEKRKCTKTDAEEKNTVLSVAGFDLTDKNTDFKQLRQTVGMVFQYPEYQLFAETVFDDVAFGLKNFQANVSDSEVESAVKDALTVVGLNFEEVKNRSPFELSGGQKRRVAIAGVLVTKPQILVLDEPAAGLDPLGKQEIMSLLHRLHQSWCKTVIIVSHDMDEIAENCNRAAIFSEGKIVAVDTPQALFSSSVAENAGLDVPFTAKTAKRMHALGVEISTDYTMDDFIQKTLFRAKTGGVCTRLTDNGGQENA